MRDGDRGPTSSGAECAANESVTAASRDGNEEEAGASGERRALANYSVLLSSLASLLSAPLLLCNAAAAAAATVIRNEKENEGINLREARLSAHGIARVNRNRSTSLCGGSLTRGRNRFA